MNKDLNLVICREIGFNNSDDSYNVFTENIKFYDFLYA